MRDDDQPDAHATSPPAASDGDGVVILTDLGSAVMTAEMVLEFLEPEARDRVRLAEAA
ncbi:PTS-dependent dihydroxyacetone kinase phosphotransferase subunit DhaM, partial [Arthrobacter bussei]|uniref:PTS-dependent dihydroxyacetone kinase phosphotransferase subunit DhaM n=1 Tax=Arthrobacter bussei TaxID=2594179 RepID=UPI003BA93D81